MRFKKEDTNKQGSTNLHQMEKAFTFSSPDNFSIPNQPLEMTLQNSLDDLADHIIAQAIKKIQNHYNGICFEQMDLKFLIIQIIKSKYTIFLQSNNIAMEDLEINRNVLHPKSFVEYHLLEYILKF